MTNKEFKAKARLHQINFKGDAEIGVSADRYYIMHHHRGDIPVRSALHPHDLRDDDGNYRIFYSAFRAEITRTLGEAPFSMVSNLLRSEHIPYNVFFPMRHDLAGAAKVMNALLGDERIATVNDIMIEHNPGTLNDRTAFDVYMPYTSVDGRRGGIGIEVKYTEKEYPIKPASKEWNETHNAAGIHLAPNYRRVSENAGWWRHEYIADAPTDTQVHVVTDRYRQIWRNHMLGAALVLDGLLDEFFTLTVYPQGNGHFDSTLWDGYRQMLTPAGKATLKTCTYEQLFPLMRRHISMTETQSWIDYLESRYIVK